MAITGGGLVRTSDHVVTVPAGTPCYNDAALTKLRTKISGTVPVTLEYFGMADDGPNSYAVEVSTGTGFSDGITRPVILYINRAAVVGGRPLPKPVPVVPPPVDNTDLLAKLALAQKALETALAAEAAAKAAADLAKKAETKALAEADAARALSDAANARWNAAQAELTRSRTFVAAHKAMGL